MRETYDFSGWATRNDLICSDGRVIRKDAFKDDDAKTVPLVWQHMHNSPENVLGHAVLYNKDEGVYTFCKFNNSELGVKAKELVVNGDVTALSIYANQLRQRENNVVHGSIKEVSLVLAGANPGASIDNVYISHSDYGVEDERLEEEAIMYFDQPIEHLAHADEEETKNEAPAAEEGKEQLPEEIEKALAYYDKLSDEEKEYVDTLVAVTMTMAEDDDSEKAEGSDDSEAKHSDEGDTDMKYNVFEGTENPNVNVLTHSDQAKILDMAKSAKYGSFQAALEAYSEENGLAHDSLTDVSGFPQVSNNESYVGKLFPEYAEVRPGAPELITNDQGWVGTVMAKVHKSPISRIRTSFVDIRNIDELRAKGYRKGDQKAIAGNLKLVRRTHDPQTVYVKSELHRDDIADITDFDYVQYLYNIDRMMLNEELATAILVGDQRDEASAYKIHEEHIRPIWTDDDLYVIHTTMDTGSVDMPGDDMAMFGNNYMIAETMINTVLYAREKYKGTGTPDFFISPHMLNVMLLARDLNGRRIYASKAELAAALNVNDIVTVEKFDGLSRTVTKNGSEVKKDLVGIICNLADYSLGSTKGGEITHFTQFDIDFNKQKSLLETRLSGALTRVYSAIVIEKPHEGN